MKVEDVNEAVAAAKAAGMAGESALALQILTDARYQILGAAYADANGWRPGGYSSEAAVQHAREVEEGREAASAGALIVRALVAAEQLATLRGAYDRIGYDRLQQIVDAQGLPGVWTLRRLHAYDSVAAADLPPDLIRLFEDACVGDPRRTNLTIQGRINRGPAILTTMRVSHCISGELTLGINGRMTIIRRIEDVAAHSAALHDVVPARADCRVDVRFRGVPEEPFYVYLEGWEAVRR